MMKDCPSCGNTEIGFSKEHGVWACNYCGKIAEVNFTDEKLPKKKKEVNNLGN